MNLACPILLCETVAEGRVRDRHRHTWMAMSGRCEAKAASTTAESASDRFFHLLSSSQNCHCCRGEVELSEHGDDREKNIGRWGMHMVIVEDEKQCSECCHEVRRVSKGGVAREL